MYCAVGSIVAALFVLGGASLSPDYQHWFEPEGSTVLVLGDSHINTSFGKRLWEQLSEHMQANTTVVGSCGRWAKAFIKGQSAHCGLRIIEPDGKIRWGKGCKLNPCRRSDGPACRKQACRTPTIGVLLAAHQPELTIIALGSNSIFRGSGKDHWRKVGLSVRELADRVVASGSACLWVTPPHGLNKSRAKLRRFAAFIRETTQGVCSVFDSSPDVRPYLDYAHALKEAGKDHPHDRMHYDRLGKAGRWRILRWAREITTESERLLLERHAGPIELARRIYEEFKERINRALTHA